MGRASGFGLPQADNISPKAKTGLHSDTVWYDREYIQCQSREIGVLWVCFLSLILPVGDVLNPKCAANICTVGVVIIHIRIHLPQFWVESRGHST